MEQNILHVLIINAALLLVLSTVFEITYLIKSKYRFVQPVLSGILIALICTAVMLVPFNLQSGIVFDTRSIIISVTALIFGLVPTVITVLAAVILRLVIGGVGLLPGIVVILTSALIGLAWRRWIYSKVTKKRWLSILAMSIVVHVVMLACMLLLPYPTSLNVLRAITLPVMLIYPIVTILLCLLLTRQQILKQTRNQLKQSEERFKLLFDKAPLGYQSLDFDGNLISVNQKWCDVLGYRQEEVLGKWFGDFLTPTFKNMYQKRFPIFKEQGYIHSEFEMLHKSGEVLFIAFDGKIGHDIGGDFKQTHCIMQDITNQRAAEIALAESEQKYRNLAENMSDILWQVDLNLNTTYVSPSVIKLIGATPKDYMAMSLSKKFPPKALNDIYSTINEELKNEDNPTIDKDRSRTIEIEHYKVDGSVIWLETNVSILRDHDGNAIAFQGVSRDITKRKIADMALEESERSKSLLISNLPGMAYRCSFDREWTMQFVSNGSVQLTGYTPANLINNRDISFNDLIAPEYRDIVWNRWQQNLSTKQPFKYEYEIITRHGTRKWVIEMGEGVFDDKGNVLALEGIILDISDRKKAEEQLQNSLERTQSMINNHEAAMLLIEPLTGRIIEANKSASRFYGFSKEELLNMSIQEINVLNKDEINSSLQEALNKGQKNFTFPHRIKNGEIKIVDVYSSPIENDGKIVLFSIIFDVTKREEIRKQNEFLAYHDHLTGLFNRRFFEEEFEKRTKIGEYPIALLLGDIDGFKEINDSFGHAEGDRILKEMAQRISRLVGDKDVLARIGGDEFAIMVSEKSEQEIRKYLDLLEKSDDNSLERELPSVSWGYGIQRDTRDTIDAITEEAEAFMYNRKYYSHKSTRSKAVDVIMKALFTKSEREEKHSQRVGNLCEAIATKMQLAHSEIDKIRVAGYLHDLGKIGIDETILNKPSKLDTKEWELMKLHPAKGAGILENTSDYRGIADIVLSHHEHYDGTGYPRGLKATAIPLGARIIAIADAYDAITNERPYKRAVDQETAILEMKKYSGLQFDPKIVSIFINEVLGRTN